MKKILLAGCIAAILPGVANALNVPQPTSYDARIQEATYNPDDAVLVRVKAGTSTLIKLQDGEFITDDQAGMGFGDPDAWDVSVRGNNIFIRPIAEQPDTNVTLVSNKRTYVFFLQSVKGNPSWMVRFKYPKNIVLQTRQYLKGRLVNLMVLIMRTGIISCKVKNLLHHMKYGMMGALHALNLIRQAIFQ